MPVIDRLGADCGKAALLTAAGVFLASCYAAVYAGQGVIAQYIIYMPLGMDFYLQGSLMSTFIAVTASLLSFIIMYYSQGYIKDNEYKGEFYAVSTIFLASMMGLVYSVNLVWLFVFWELTAICSWRLVGYFRAPNDIAKANKTFLVTVFGALFLLLAIVDIAQANGSLNLPDLAGAKIPVSAAVFLVLAAFSKSAIFPFSTWLPDAGVAPSPVTALLHAAVLVKIGVFAFVKIFFYIPLDVNVAQLVMYVAGISSLIAGGAALKETNIKRIIAYSTISQLGFIFLGIAAGGGFGLLGALIFILMHGVAKGGLFLCAGIIEHKTHTKDITKMGGLYKVLPWTAFAFGFCALSVMGIPPFGGFFSKFAVFIAAARTGGLPIVIIFGIAALFTVAYLTRVFYIVFLGPALKEYSKGAHEAPHQMMISVVFLAVLSLLLGFIIKLPIDFLWPLCGGVL